MAGFSLNASPVQKYRVVDFSGGLNNKHSQESLKPNESHDLLNVVFDERGRFRKRPGVSVDLSYPQKAGVEILDLFEYVKRNGTRIYVVSYVDGTISAYDGSTVSNLTLNYGGDTSYHHSGKPFAHFIFNDILYFGNKTDGWFKYTGTGEITYVPTIPKCDYAVLKDIRAFYGGNDVQPDRLFYSHQGNPENVDAILGTDETQENVGGLIDFLSEDVRMTGLSTFQGDILVFKRDAVFSLSGFNYTDFEKKQLNVASGCIAPESIIRGDNVVYYIGNGGLYYIYATNQNQIETTPVSDLVTPEFEGDLSGIKSAYFKGKLYLFFPNKTMIFNESLKSWTKWDTVFTTSVFDETRGTLVFGGTEGYCYTLSNKLKDEWVLGEFTGIASHYSLASLGFEIPEMTKRHKWMKIFYQPNPGEHSIMDISIYVDYVEQKKELDIHHDTLMWEDDETEEENIWGSEYWGEMREQKSSLLRFSGTGEYIRVVFSNDQIDEELCVSGIVFGFKVKTKVR